MSWHDHTSPLSAFLLSRQRISPCLPTRTLSNANVSRLVGGGGLRAVQSSSEQVPRDACAVCQRLARAARRVDASHPSTGKIAQSMTIIVLRTENGNGLGQFPVFRRKCRSVSVHKTQSQTEGETE